MSVINYNIRISGCTDSGNKELFRIIFPLTDKKDQIALLGFDSKYIEMKIDIHKNDIQTIQTFNARFIISSGEDRFRNLNITRCEDAFLFIYNIEYESTFERVSGWIETVKSFISENFKCAIILMGNNPNLNKNIIFDEVKGKKLCEDYKIIWGGIHNINQMKYNEAIELLGKFVKETYEVVGETNNRSKREIK